MATKKTAPKVEEQPIPEINEETKSLPEVNTTEPQITYEVKQDIPAPPQGHPENMVKIGSKLIEIKPTKIKYQRDRTAAFYKALDLYPLTEILSTDAGFFDTDRNGDKCVLDWLVAVTDNPKLIIDNYNDIDTETIESLLAIFKRLNKIEEKEAKLKNLQREREGMKKV